MSALQLEAHFMKLKNLIILIAAILMMAASSGAEEADHHQIRKQAQKAYTNGNWQDAFDLYCQLSLEIQNDPKKVGIVSSRKSGWNSSVPKRLPQMSR